LPHVCRGGALALGKGLEPATPVRTRLFSGPLHQFDVAGFSHGQKCFGIQPGDRIEWSVQDGTLRSGLADQALALEQAALDAGVIGISQFQDACLS
jgi:hypothetical protein